jgi:tetratricopeptide (TPR) repeat protein
MSRISSGTRKRLSLLFGGRCPLCSLAFMAFDAHHIKFVSLGGTDSEENLLPLCPNCHRIYAHKLKESFDVSLLGRIRTQRLELVSLEGSIRSQLSNNPYRAAKLLLKENTLELVLRFGRYERFLVFSKHIAQNLSSRTATDRVIRARVTIFGGEMALYSEQESFYYSIVSGCLPVLEKSKELAPIRSNAELVLARLAGRTGLSKEERELFEERFPYDTSSMPHLRQQWLFRKVAYHKTAKQFEKALELAEQGIAASEGVEKDSILVSNILSEIARIHLYVGDTVEARQIFQKVLEISIDKFHRRGILLTSIYLAKVN